ncbi:WecB/TagA/CpsF family glycosyltransferase [Synechococcus sp. PCC 7336]|uniref:WecB/TagA/CpsF family glycosyltransferase n=1 Tax=Synechococcus sp. PCC 7336 TaxID=195250 RepID=UPI00034A8554|nr:WecB/TagA/CpsF family glycosyltransferase [Synechococcus sp. PCC 7336]
MEQFQFLNASLDNITRAQLLERLRWGGTVFTLNVDHLKKLQQDAEFYRAYTSATYRVCDSQVLTNLSRLSKRPLKEKIAGSDLLPAYCRYYRDKSEVTMFLLGAAPGVAQQAQQVINASAGRQLVVDTYSPDCGFERDRDECQRIVDRINASGATTLVVGLGAPKQEIWIYRHRHQLERVKVFLALGAAIDFIAGQRERSPRWMSDLGLEWLHRLLQEPKRLWRRYLVDGPPIFWMFLLDVCHCYRFPVEQRQPLQQLLDAQPIGRVLQRAGLLTAERVDRALTIQAQQQPRQSFGEIVAERGWLDRATVDFFVEQLPTLAQTMRQRPLGQYLKAAGLLDDSQIESILQEQAHTGELFGQIAVKRGWVFDRTVEFFLNYVAPDCETLPYSIFTSAAVAEKRVDWSQRDRGKLPTAVSALSEISGISAVKQAGDFECSGERA